MGVSRSEPSYQTTARPHELYCNEVSSRIIADLRDERDQLNEAILALERMPFHVLSVQFLTNGRQPIADFRAFQRLPITGWPQLVETWLATIGMISQ